MKIKVISKEDLLNKAFGRARKKSAKKAKNLKAIKTKEIGKINTASNILSRSLRDMVENTFSYDELDEFYKEMVSALIDVDKFRKSLGGLNWASKKITEFNKIYTKKLKGCGDPSEARRIRKQFYGRISSVMERVEKDIEYLFECRKSLKAVPKLKNLPTIVIAGFPNVGKSSLLAELTGSRPKVDIYPFTTKNLKIGFFRHKYRRIQVIDTPGILDRPIEKRNKIERQAVSALKHLADLVIYIYDPSETYPPKEQKNLFKEVKNIFGKNVIRVVNKMDIAEKGELENIGEADFRISLKTGKGVDKLKGYIKKEIMKVM